MSRGLRTHIWCGWCLDYTGVSRWPTHLERHVLADRVEREAKRNARRREAFSHSLDDPTEGADHP